MEVIQGFVQRGAGELKAQTLGPPPARDFASDESAQPAHTLWHDWIHPEQTSGGPLSESHRVTAKPLGEPGGKTGTGTLIFRRLPCSQSSIYLTSGGGHQ